MKTIFSSRMCVFRSSKRQTVITFLGFVCFTLLIVLFRYESLKSYGQNNLTELSTVLMDTETATETVFLSKEEPVKRSPKMLKLDRIQLKASSVSSKDEQRLGHHSLFKETVMNRTSQARKVLTDHGMELPVSGGVAKRVLLVTTWRSGSTFTGELLAAVPGALFNFEPLVHMIYKDIELKDRKSAAFFMDEILRMLQCDYAPLHHNLRYTETLKTVLLQHNKAFEEICRATKTRRCHQEELLSFACKYFPVQVTKSVRMPLRYILPLLRQAELNLHLVLLVRDPRGTMASRRRLMWCMEPCSNLGKHCALLRDNYEHALKASKEFPDTFTVLRYEDLAMDPVNVSAWLLRRLEIPQTPSVTKYVETHMGSERGRETETVRVRGSRVSLWRENLPWDDVQAIQNTCGDILEKYGYVPVTNSASLNETETVIHDWRFSSNVGD